MALCVTALVLLAIFYPSKTHGDRREALAIQTNPLSSLSVNSSKEEKLEAIRYAAVNNGVVPQVMIDFSNGCENVGLKDICIVDTNGKQSCGYFMFQELTMKHYCPDLKWGWEYPADNITCAARMFAQGLDVIKHNWTNCSKSILGL